MWATQATWLEQQSVQKRAVFNGHVLYAFLNGMNQPGGVGTCLDAVEVLAQTTSEESIQALTDQLSCTYDISPVKSNL